MIELIASASLGGIVGFFTCAMMTMSKVADVRAECGEDCTACAPLRERVTRQEGMIGRLVGMRINAERAHARATDRGNTLQARIDRLKSIAASQQSVKSGRIVAVLEGDA